MKNKTPDKNTSPLVFMKFGFEITITPKIKERGNDE